MAMEWSSWCRSPNYLFDKVDEADDRYKKISVPVYSISAEDDSFAPQNVVDWISQRYQNAKVTRIHLTAEDLKLKSIGHFGYFRSDKKIVWHQLLDILKKFA
jgi:predicted alpha/beta hydrolase